jgi:hypothetical protein
MGETNIPQDSPHTRAALMLPITAPAHPTQESSVVHSRKVVLRQRDSKIIVSKFSGSNVGQNTPVLKTASVLSKYLPPALMRSLRSSPVLEGDKYVPKREERWLVSTAVSKNITGVVRCTPHSQVAPALPKATPASPLSTRSTYPTANKIGSSSVVHHLSMLRTAPTLSNLSPCVHPCPSGPSPLPEGDKTSFKTEERQLHKTAVSKNMTSVARHSPSPWAAPALPKAERVGVKQAARSILSGNQPEPARSPQNLSFTHHGVKPIAPVVVKGEYMKTAHEQSHAPRPNAVPRRIASGPPTLGLKVMADTRWCSATNIISKSLMRSSQHSPEAQTAPMLSKLLPSRPLRAISCPVPMRIRPIRQVNNAVKKDL